MTKSLCSKASQGSCGEGVAVSLSQWGPGDLDKGKVDEMSEGVGRGCDHL